MKHLTFSAIIILFFFSACKKANSPTPAPLKPEVFQIKSIDAESTTDMTLSYDAKARLTNKKTYLNFGEYTEQNFFYDASDRVIKVTGDYDRLISYEGGRIATIETSPTGNRSTTATEKYTYNSDGRVVLKDIVYKTGNLTSTIQQVFTYNTNGDLIKISGKDDNGRDLLVEITGYNDDMNLDIWQIEDFHGFFRYIKGPVLAGLKHFPREVKITLGGEFYNKTVYNFEIKDKKLTGLNFTTDYVGTPGASVSHYFYKVNY